MTTCITSFTSKGYEVYGKEFIRTFIKHWPKSVKLVVYYEGSVLIDQTAENIEWFPIEVVYGLHEFMEKIKNFPIMTGVVNNKYNINWDARMARKTYMEAYALSVYGGKVFWLDADAVTHTDVPETFLDECLPDDKFCCYLGREPWYYTESGFLGFNASHPIAEDFIRKYISVFTSGIFLTLPGWHDCFAFDFIRNHIKQNDAFVNLSSHVKHGEMHPYVMSAPGKYMDHLKGPRKTQGHSKEHPLWDGGQYKTA